MCEVSSLPRLLLAGVSLALLLTGAPVLAQETKTAATGSAASSASAATAAEPLSDADLEELVARIALYPDEIVALIAAASLYPLQVIQAERYLEKVKTDKTLKPDDGWDGSVISLLNYPEVVKMMSDDLDWTQAMGDAITNQQGDVLLAIQQLRDKAVADDVIKTDDKITVVNEGDNVEIHPTNVETIYIPQYAPEMLYEPGYSIAPIEYYPEPYYNYYYPTAPYFAGFVTGAWWAAAVDWNDGFWGGDWHGGNIDIDCNQCLINRPDFDGKINIGDVDWRNVDRDKLNFDRNEINNIDRSEIRNQLKSREANNLHDRAGDLQAGREARGDRAAKINDVRQNHLGAAALGGAALGGAAGLAAGQLGQRDINRQDLANRAGNRPEAGNRPNAAPRPADRPSASTRPANRDTAGAADRAAKKEVRSGGKTKPGAKADTRPKNPSALGQPGSGKKTKAYSNRGKQSMGGGQRSQATPSRSQRSVSPARPSRSMSSGSRSRSMSSGGRSRSMGGGGRRGGGGGGRGRR